MDSFQYVKFLICPSVYRFNSILETMVTELSAGADAARYIRAIEPAAYARHAFPLPRHGQITSNPCEQANSGLLSIRMYAPFKILVEIWLYLQARFVERRRKALATNSIYTGMAFRRHEQNLRSFGQWQVTFTRMHVLSVYPFDTALALCQFD